jgi:fluoroacetyl-CoA thioesterase
METKQVFQVGMQAEQTFRVTDADTASHVGSGSLRVLATPSMIGFMERVARAFMDEYLPEGTSSVGVHVDVHHLAATPVGNELRVACEIIEVEGRRIDFFVQAWDDFEKVGEGHHQRVVIDVERFLKRLQAKQKPT